ncbi:SagB-type dehydrogenase family enzyme [Streptomyces sp. 2333.5]|uniref:SagB family peptide dehydrogenase n=1 Tax=unclassified Streptomyces TaxID=2593676 RepID=UPI00089D8211|nr:MULTISPECIES: SagB family peptide dehydrogenase [unclassified Streptomyces]PJJ02993.1 SagB-type dehydrogenase family enzyme [Streptomyces sp. 2333.5]SED63960.1 SagB-type dehydrogenase domain-containing protein [Streptomyces sp. 2314.4]SEE25115.1 SagB-type dehydrogenase domain-containing protein [Streptomyces sp. 2112.2]
MTAADTGAPPLSGDPSESGPFDDAGVDGFVRRLRGSYEEVHPQHWQIDWRNIPSPFRWYVDLPRRDLPTMSRAVAAGGPAAVAAFAASDPATRLGALLQAGYGLTGVRWYPDGIAKSSPEEPTPVHRNPHYQLRRAMPSGGVTYPAECYVVTAGTEGLDAGMYHYDAVRHALAVLAGGRPPAELTPPAGSVRIVLTQPLWKNYFKYGDFSYRLGAMDTGAVVGQFALAARSWNLRARVAFGVDERRITDLLGLDAEEEAAPAVVDIALGDPAEAERGRAVGAAAPVGRPRWLGASAPPGPTTGTRRMHAACLAAGRPGRPIDLPPVALEDVADRVDAELPAVSGRPVSVADSWARSALGEQLRGSPLPADVLADWLTTVLAPLDCDATGSGDGNGLTHPRCVLVVRSVPGVPPGAYVPHQDGRRLARLAEGDFGPVVQRSMFAHYMNVGQAPLIAVMVGATEPHRGASGPVGYRTQHLLAGVLAQRLAVCAARDGRSAHPVLGFVSGVLDEAFGLGARRLTSLLMVPVGGYRRGLYLENSLSPLAAPAGDGGGI